MFGIPWIGWEIQGWNSSHCNSNCLRHKVALIFVPAGCLQLCLLVVCCSRWLHSLLPPFADATTALPRLWVHAATRLIFHKTLVLIPSGLCFSSLLNLFDILSFFSQPLPILLECGFSDFLSKFCREFYITIGIPIYIYIG